MPQTTSIQEQQAEKLEKLMIDLGGLDENEIETMSEDIIRLYLVPTTSLDTLAQATHTLTLIAFEKMSRDAGRGSTHALIDAHYVSDRALRDVYYAQLRDQEEIMLVYPDDPTDENAMHAYHQQCNVLAEKSKSWPIYHALEQRGIIP